MRRTVRTVVCLVALLVAAAPAQVSEQNVQSAFHVRYVASDAIYVDGGRSAGLAEGMRLVIKAPVSADANQAADMAADPAYVAEFRVVSVAETSAVCEVVSTTRPVVVGDVVTLPAADLEMLVQKRALSSTRRYPAVVSFTEGDPMDEDVREQVPRPPLPEVNQARGRIGVDYSGTSSGGAFQSTASQVGLVLRADITRIAGTHWNLSGYWRGELQSRSSVQPTIQDLMNRTYHMSLSYVNPQSAWVAGVGRMYLPWASSLDTIDGGYFGRKLSKQVTAGIFGGSTPDPTSWSYNPNRRLAGSFVNFDGGDWEGLKYSATFGAGLSTLGWTLDRPFGFTETNIAYKRVFSLYDSMQVDSPRSGDPTAPAVGPGLGQSFLTIRIQPQARVEIDVNHNYFRDVPTYDPQLVGTGLLDRYLFQGFSFGTRVQGPKHLTFYTTVGRSNTSTDSKSSWNEMFGATMSRIWKTGLTADLRYSKFDSAFAQGSYKSLTLSRYLGHTLQWQIVGGTQAFVSPFTNDSGSRFVNTHLDVMLGTHYFLEGGFTVQRGALQNYDQWYTSFGYVFDNRPRKLEVKDDKQK